MNCNDEERIFNCLLKEFTEHLDPEEIDSFCWVNSDFDMAGWDDFYFMIDEYIDGSSTKSDFIYEMNCLYWGEE